MDTEIKQENTNKSAGKRIGYFFLGLLPWLTALLLQIIVPVFFVLIDSVLFGIRLANQQIMPGTPEYRQAILDYSRNLATSPVVFYATFGMYISYVLIFGIWYYFQYCRKKQTGSYKQVFRPHRFIAILFAGVLLQIGIDMALALLLPLFPKTNEFYQTLMESMLTDSLFMEIALCLLAPLTEEILFRGLIFRTLRRAIPVPAAIILQALLFGIFHMNIVQGIYATLLGICFGCLAYRYNSVIPGILLHMSINCSSYLVGFLLPDSLEQNPLAMIAIGIAALIAIPILLYIACKNVKQIDIPSAQTV